MPDIDFSLLHLVTAVIGSVTAVAAVAGAVIQYRSAKLELQARRQEQLSLGPRTQSKRSEDEEPPQ